MLLILDVIIAALASYVAYKTFQAWRDLSEARLSLYSVGMVLLAASLVLEAVVDIYLNWLTGTEPARFIRRQEAFFRLAIQLLTTAALVPIAIAVTPSLFYAVVPPLFPPGADKRVACALHCVSDAGEDAGEGDPALHPTRLCVPRRLFSDASPRAGKRRPPPPHSRHAYAGRDLCREGEEAGLR